MKIENCKTTIDSEENLKELRESRCWIRPIIKTEMLPEHRMVGLFDECNQLCNIITQAIVTAKKRKEKKA